jgi:ABC-2 type transport system permease protein
MRNIWYLFKKEFRGYFNSPSAYIFIVVFLVLTNWLFFRSFFLMGQANMRGFFGLVPWIFLFFIPAVAMRLWAEEKKLGTMELLMTFPIRDHEAVAGKYLAAFAFILITVLLTLPLPATLKMLVQPEVGIDLGPIIGGYVGILFLGGAYLAIGSFASSLTQNQIIAFVLGVTISFALFIVGENFVLISVPSALAPLFEYLGLGSHFDSISRGVIDTRDVVYYLSVIIFFIFLNVRIVESRRWR